MESFYERLFIIEQDENYLKETEEYHEFVKRELGNIIAEFAYESYPMQIARKCWSTLENLELNILSYILIFLKKYNLMDVHTTKDHEVWCYPSLNLNSEMIRESYEKELAYVNSKASQITKPSIFERLNGFETIEERQAHIKELSQNYQESLRLSEEENAYTNFILDRENGLYNLLEKALADFDFRGFVLTYNNWHISYSFIKEFCDKYGIVVNMIERNDKVNKDLLVNIKTIDDIRYLFQCFFGELQKIEHFSKSPEQLWQENIAFVNANKEWIEERKGRRG